MSCLLIMAGGTGGHVFPALAVAEILRARNIDIHWMGTAKGLEARVVPQANIPLHTIDVAGIRGKSLVKKVTGPLGLLKSIFQAIKILRRIKPNAVMGMGGYASGPGGVAAKLLGIPLIIHEQNAKAGSTNKILAKVATRVLTGFPGVLSRGQFVGNPVRESFYRQAPPAERFSAVSANASFRLLVLGGSLGARALNTLVPQALETLVSGVLLRSGGLMAESSFQPSPLNIRVTHQAGARTLSDAHAAYAALKSACNKQPLDASPLALECDVVEFIDDVAGALAQADLVICRSGALTVAELAAVGAASILVPYPYAVDDHQTANGNWLVERQGAQLLQESALTGETLAHAIANYLIHREKVHDMAAAAWLREPKTATDTVAEICLEYLNV